MKSASSSSSSGAAADPRFARLATEPRFRGLARKGRGKVVGGGGGGRVAATAPKVVLDERFKALYFDDWLVEDVIERFGEPPVAEDEGDASFSDYLRQAVVWAATPRVRRAISAQARRFIPAYVEAGQIREALAIENNAYLTVMSDAVTPLLAQLMVGALSRWYDEHEEE